MITKVTKENRIAVEKRLEEISRALGKPINNIEEYYQNIVAISALPTANGSLYKYFLMPLDEPMFEIDANTRKITVPQHFAKNGVGVHGDHMAEILYFSIDRYFDYQDLYSCDDIVINWQFRPQNASRNASVETHTSYALAPDDTYLQGKIVFGWVIGNYVQEENEENNPVIAQMTSGRGTLTFSISFIKHKENTNELDYVLNTQTASVTIYDSLVVDDIAKLNPAKGSAMFNRLVNSAYTPKSMNPLIAPVFLSGDELSSDNGLHIFSGLNSFANFEYERDNHNNVIGEKAKLVLTARAGTLDDATGIIYEWSGADYNKNPVNLENNGEYRITMEAVKTEDVEFNENKNYYIKVSGGYQLLANEDEFTAALEAHESIYELGSSCEVPAGGTYTVAISSWKDISQDGVQVTATSPQVKSIPCFVPKAAVPSVSITLEDNDNEIFTEARRLTKVQEGDYHVQTEVDGKLTYFDYKYFDQEDKESNPPKVIANIAIDKTKIGEYEYNASGDKILKDGTVEGVTNNSSLGFVKLEFVNGKEQPSSFSGEKHFVENGISLNIGELELSRNDGEWTAFCENTRNQTVSVSDISNSVYISKVAPTAQPTVTVCPIKVTNGVGEEDISKKVTLIDNGVSQYNPLADQLYSSNTDIILRISLPELEVIPEKITVEAVEKIKQEKIDPETGEVVKDDKDKIVYEIVDLSPANPDRDAPDLYEAVFDADKNNYVISGLQEGGYFIFRVTTLYHGTKRITESEAVSIART